MWLITAEVVATTAGMILAVMPEEDKTDAMKAQMPEASEETEAWTQG